MKPLQIAQAARAVVQSITSKEPEVVSRCERQDPNWKVMVEVIETKARIDDNDLIASYEVEIDPAGELVGYERVRRYKRAQGVLTA